MLNLNINETRTLDFEVQISGIDPDQLKGSLRFEINNVEYGFPAEFKNESILVNIPPLKNILSTPLKEGTTLKATLEVNANGFYLNPWDGDFVISNPIKMEAKIKEDSIPKVSVGKLLVDKKEESYDIIDENVDRNIDKLFEKKSKVKSSKQKRVIEENVDSKLNELYKKKSKVKSAKPKSSPKVMLESVTEDQVYMFMEHMGTRDKNIQEIVYEQCRQKSQTDEPKDVLKEIYKMLKKR